MCQYVGLKHMQTAERDLLITEMEKSHAQGFYKNLHSTDVARMTEEGLIGSFLHVTDLEEANHLQSLAQKSRLKIPLIIGIDAPSMATDYVAERLFTLLPSVRQPHSNLL